MHTVHIDYLINIEKYCPLLTVGQGGYNQSIDNESEVNLKTTEGLPEHLLDVCPTTEDDIYTVYDISHYLPKTEGRERKNYLDRVDFTIRGKSAIVYIIDWHEVLDNDKAKSIAIKHVKGDYTVYRLD